MNRHGIVSWVVDKNILQGGLRTARLHRPCPWTLKLQFQDGDELGIPVFTPLRTTTPNGTSENLPRQGPDPKEDASSTLYAVAHSVVTARTCQECERTVRLEHVP